MVINIPNGTNILQLKLIKVLYSLEVSYTLVSIDRLDEKGFDITCSDGKCTIKGPDGKHGALPSLACQSIFSTPIEGEHTWIKVLFYA